MKAAMDRLSLAGAALVHFARAEPDAGASARHPEAQPAEIVGACIAAAVVAGGGMTTDEIEACAVALRFELHNRGRSL